MRREKDEDFDWKLTPHVCRACFGRILVRETFDRRKVFLCSNCGASREGHDSRVICCCGLKLRPGIDMGVRCQENENRSPEWPGLIVAQQVQATVEKLKTDS